MYLKIDNIKGTNEMLKKIAEIERLSRELRRAVSDLQLNGLCLDVTTDVEPVAIGKIDNEKNAQKFMGDIVSEKRRGEQV